MKKVWKTIIVFSIITLIMDMVMHIETEPRWVLGVYTAVWYVFGCFMGEATAKDK